MVEADSMNAEEFQRREREVLQAAADQLKRVRQTAQSAGDSDVHPHEQASLQRTISDRIRRVSNENLTHPAVLFSTTMTNNVPLGYQGFVSSNAPNEEPDGPEPIATTEASDEAQLGLGRAGLEDFYRINDFTGAEDLPSVNSLWDLNPSEELNEDPIGPEVFDHTTTASDFDGLNDAEEESAAVLGVALQNYETFHHMAQGSATIDMLQHSSAGIYGWLSCTTLHGTPSTAEEVGRSQDSPKIDEQEVTQKSKRARWIGPKDGPLPPGDDEEARQLQIAILESIGVKANCFYKCSSPCDDLDSEDEDYQKAGQDAASVDYESECEDGDVTTISDSKSNEGDSPGDAGCKDDRTDEEEEKSQSTTTDGFADVVEQVKDSATDKNTSLDGDESDVDESFVIVEKAAPRIDRSSWQWRSFTQHIENSTPQPAHAKVKSAPRDVSSEEEWSIVDPKDGST